MVCPLPLYILFLLPLPSQKLPKLIQKLLASFEAEKGYTEGKNNHTKYAKEYFPNLQNQPWCDTLVDSMFVKTFGKETAEKMLGGFSAYTPTSAKMYQDMGRWHKAIGYYIPQPGDQIFFQTKGGPNRINHTGIVTRVDQKTGTVYTIEGNTSAKPGDRDEPDMMPAATQALPTQPPEGAAEEVRAGDAAAPSLDPATIAANNTEFEPEPAPVAPPKPKPVEPLKPKVEAPPAPKPEPKPVVEEKAAPTGKAYVVQLGALKNADKVNEIVGKLRGAGYRVYTSPSTPVQGKITRILVGPDASKEKLKGSLGELKQLSGLSGVVMGYTPN